MEQSANVMMLPVQPSATGTPRGSSPEPVQGSKSFDHVLQDRIRARDAVHSTRETRSTESTNETQPDETNEMIIQIPRELVEKDEEGNPTISLETLRTILSGEGNLEGMDGDDLVSVRIQLGEDYVLKGFLLDGSSKGRFGSGETPLILQEPKISNEDHPLYKMLEGDNGSVHAVRLLNQLKTDAAASEEETLAAAKEMLSRHTGSEAQGKTGDAETRQTSLEAMIQSIVNGEGNGKTTDEDAASVIKSQGNAEKQVATPASLLKQPMTEEQSPAMKQAVAVEAKPVSEDSAKTTDKAEATVSRTVIDKEALQKILAEESKAKVTTNPEAKAAANPEANVVKKTTEETNPAKTVVTEARSENTSKESVKETSPKESPKELVKEANKETAKELFGMKESNKGKDNPTLVFENGVGRGEAKGEGKTSLDARSQQNDSTRDTGAATVVKAAPSRDGQGRQDAQQDAKQNPQTGSMLVKSLKASDDSAQQKNGEVMQAAVKSAVAQTAMDAMNPSQQAQARPAAEPAATNPNQSSMQQASSQPSVSAPPQAQTAQGTQSLTPSNAMEERVAKVQEAMNQQIVRGVQGAIGSERSFVGIRLSPESLGRIYVQLTFDQGSLSAQITAQKESTRALMESSVNSLRQAFDDQGIKVERLAINKDSLENRFADQQKDQQGQRSRQQNDGQGGFSQSGQQNGERRGSKSNTNPWLEHLTHRQAMGAY